MDSYKSVLAKISVLQQKASALRETEKKKIISELRRLVEHYDVQPAELFSKVKSSKSGLTTGKRGRGKGKIKGKLPPKYQDPVSGKTWSGHGKRPLWFVGDKEKFLIDPSSGVKSSVKAKKGAGASWQTRIAKLTEATKATKGTGKKRGRKPKSASPKVESGAEAAAHNSATAN